MNRLFETFRELVAIDSPAFGERRLCDSLKGKLAALGAVCEEDNAGELIKGNCGNLYGFLPGEMAGAPLLFSAHMDTVEPALGKTAVLLEDGRITSNGATVLGADDVSGIAAILEAIARLRETGTPHRPIELLFTAAEELYGMGSAVANYDKLRAKEAYVLDLGGAVGEAANAAPTLLSFTVDMHGKAAHAAFGSHAGVHAIAAAAKAIARIPQGEPEPGLTCNIGTIKGGEARNIVPALCTVNGEIRSMSHAAVMVYWEMIKSIFEDEARQAEALVEFSYKIEISAYETPLDSPVVRRFEQACKAAGIPCYVHSTLGGSDNNNYATHGIEGLVIACSMYDVHSTREYTLLDELEQCVTLVTHLMTAEEP